MLHSDAAATLSYDELTGDLQHALAALADIEFEFQSACERLNDQSGPEAGKTRVRQQLEAERCRRREPLIQRLDELDRRVKAFVFSRGAAQQVPSAFELPAHAAQALA